MLNVFNLVLLQCVSSLQWSPQSNNSDALKCAWPFEQYDEELPTLLTRISGHRHSPSLARYMHIMHVMWRRLWGRVQNRLLLHSAKCKISSCGPQIALNPSLGIYSLETGLHSLIKPASISEIHSIYPKSIPFHIWKILLYEIPFHSGPGKNVPYSRKFHISEFLITGIVCMLNT